LQKVHYNEKRENMIKKILKSILGGHGRYSSSDYKKHYSHKGIIPIKKRLITEAMATIITRKNIKAAASFQAFSAVNTR
jgi:hypothetical protein